MSSTRTIDLDGESVYWWVKSCKRFWESLLHLLYFVVTSTADYAVEIAARAIAISAPLPNAISVNRVTQTALGFHWVAALAFSVVVEVAVFALVELSLYLFDGFLRNPKKWAIPFALSVLSVVVGIAVVIAFVYKIEQLGAGHTIMAWLPVISLCAFLSIGLKRWHDRQPEITGAKTGQRKPKQENPTEISEKPKTSVEEMNAAKQEKIRKRQLEISNVVSENGPLSVSEIGPLLSVSVSDKTIANDLNELLSQGKIVKDGRKWTIVASTLPVSAIPVLNGHGKQS